MAKPASIMEFVQSVLDDIGVIDESHPDHDRVDIGWREAMEAIKGHIKNGVPLLNWKTDGVKLSEEQLAYFFNGDDADEIARYMVSMLVQGQFDMRGHIEDIIAHEGEWDDDSDDAQSDSWEVK